MRKSIFTLFILLLGFQLQASDGGDKYVEAMKKALSMMDTASTVQTYQNCANRFERIGKAEKKEWLPYYYAGICYSLMIYSEKDMTKIDPMLDRADEYLDMALDMKLKDFEKSEILVVKGMVAGGRIMVEPQTRSMKYGPMSGQYYQRAANLNPENPRALSMSGQSLMFTPKQFGGGRDKAIPVMEDALAKYEAWEDPYELFPDWGKELTEGQLEFAKSGEKAPWEEGADTDSNMEEPKKEGASEEKSSEGGHDHAHRDHGHDHGEHGHDHDGGGK